MEEKKPLKIKFKTAVILIIVAVIIIGVCGANVYASKHGYDNIFFLIKYKISGRDDRITDRDKLLLEDDDKNVINNQSKALKFSEDEVKKSFQKYLDLVGAKWLDSHDILIKLDLIKEEEIFNFNQAKTKGYSRTNIKYVEFKNKMLNYVTENCFENDIIILDSIEHKAYINEDGYLCCANSGSSGGDYKVQSITKVNDKQYEAIVIHLLEEGLETINYNFGIENNNGRCVVDYCNEIDTNSVQNQKNDVKFSEEEVNKVIGIYVELLGERRSDVTAPLYKLNIEYTETNKPAKKDGYIKTNILYSKFKEEILNYMTEKCFEKEMNVDNAYIDEDGFLCCSGGAASAHEYKLKNIKKVNDRKYIAEVLATLEESKKTIYFEVGIENNNGRCVIDYCNQI